MSTGRHAAQIVAGAAGHLLVNRGGSKGVPFEMVGGAEQGDYRDTAGGRQVHGSRIITENQVASLYHSFQGFALPVR